MDMGTDEFQRVIHDDNVELLDLQILDDDRAAVHYRSCAEATIAPKYGNIALACYTTAHARLKLYSFLERVDDRCVYTDTDSIVFIERPGCDNLEEFIGEGLGYLVDEVPKGWDMVEICAPGKLLLPLRHSLLQAPSSTHTACVSESPVPMESTSRRSS